MNISNRIKNRRKELGLTLKEVAEKLNVSESLISRYESNEVKNMGIDKIKPLAKALQTTPEHLMGWEEEREDKYYIDTSFLTESEKIELNKLIEMNTTMFFNGGKKLTESELKYIKFLLTRTFIETLPDKK